MTLRDEALLMLEGRGAILEVAREVSRLMKEDGIPGMVIGGVAVALHGHARTTRDVDVLLEPPLDRMRDLLLANGFTWDDERREFVKSGVPVHLVRPEDAGMSDPVESCEIDDVRVVVLPALLGMKLRSGSADVLRAQDLADVIGLIRHHRLTAEFARELDKSLRRPFRKLVRRIEADDAT